MTNSDDIQKENEITFSVDDLSKAFTGIGISKEKALETAKNSKLGNMLGGILQKVGAFESGCEKNTGNLYYRLASTVKENTSVYVDFIADQIKLGQLKNAKQVDAALTFLSGRKANACGFNLESGELEEYQSACGIGLEISLERIDQLVGKYVNETYKDDLIAKRYDVFTVIQRKVLNDAELKWAEPKAVLESYKKAVIGVIGEKTAEDCLPPAKRAINNNNNGNNINNNSNSNGNSGVVSNGTSESPSLSLLLAGNGGDDTLGVAGNLSEWKFEGEVLHLHKPGENPQLNEEIRKQHLAETGGRVVTRFPPEPNGFLHIGHAKAINFDFRYSAQHGGICYLRYDDTNPEAEEQVYFDAILDSVKWLGFTPYRITYSSDYFDRLYELAVSLIKKGKAYVCHMTPEEICESRGGKDRHKPRFNSPWRDRPVAENLAEFERMRKGEYEEGKAILRMKMDMTSGNPNMWDLVAYRVLKHPHVRTGSKWLIYPTYDFTHPLCDSLENVTHSFCTTEFEQNRENYYWLCDALSVYKPVQWEFGRLNVLYTVLSKRKLMKLVHGGIVNGWDDPRLFTMDGVRRRGIPPSAINEFVRRVGITKASTSIEPSLLDACVRDDLDRKSPRVMGILDPIRVTILDYPVGQWEDIQVPYFPSHRDDNMNYKVPFGRVIYIDASDYLDSAMADVPNDYYRLAPGKTVGLLHTRYNLTCSMDEPKRDSNGRVIEITAVCDSANNNAVVKPRARIHWIADCPKRESPIHCTVRLLNPLFRSPNPNDPTDPETLEILKSSTSISEKEKFLADVRSDSMIVKENAMVDLGVRQYAPQIGDPLQFVRTGFFSLDKDSQLGGSGSGTGSSVQYVFNRTVTLREDNKKPK